MTYLQKCNNLYTHLTKLYNSYPETFGAADNSFNELFELCNSENIRILDIHNTKNTERFIFLNEIIINLFMSIPRTIVALSVDEGTLKIHFLDTK